MAVNNSLCAFSRRFCLKPLLRSSVFSNGGTHQAIRPSRAFFTAQRLLSSSAALQPEIGSSRHTAPSSTPSLLQFISSRLNHATSRFGRPQKLTQQYGRARPPSRSQGGGSRFGGGGEGFRERFDRIPHNVVLWTILGLNGLVFVGWHVAQAHYVCTARMLRVLDCSYESMCVDRRPIGIQVGSSSCSRTSPLTGRA